MDNKTDKPSTMQRLRRLPTFEKFILLQLLCGLVIPAFILWAWLARAFQSRFYDYPFGLFLPAACIIAPCLMYIFLRSADSERRALKNWADTVWNTFAVITICAVLYKAMFNQASDISQLLGGLYNEYRFWFSLLVVFLVMSAILRAIASGYELFVRPNSSQKNEKQS